MVNAAWIGNHHWCIDSPVRSRGPRERERSTSPWVDESGAYARVHDQVEVSLSSSERGSMRQHGLRVGWRRFLNSKTPQAATTMAAVR